MCIRDRESREPELYTEEEMSVVEQHIKNTFGEFENVFHELVSPDISCDSVYRETSVPFR